MEGGQCKRWKCVWSRGREVLKLGEVKIGEIVAFALTPPVQSVQLSASHTPSHWSMSVQNIV